MPNPDTFGSRVRALAAERGLPLSTLAQKAGLHPVSLYRLASGKARPTLDTVQALARALDVPLSAFDGLADAEEKSQEST